jgi:outer membrane protein OmpA-like peptidoglycan-associated protein
LPTYFGDTGLWFVPTADTLQTHKGSFSLFRANYDDRQGLTDVNELGLTGAFALSDSVEVFGSWKLVRLRRGVRNPTFVPADAAFGGVDQNFPYLRRNFSKNLGGPITAGAKWSVISQSRGDAMSLGPRIAVEFGGNPWAGTNDVVGHIDLVGSRELAKKVELTGTVGGVIRGDPDAFSVSDGMAWGVGAILGSRSRVRGLVEWVGEWSFDENAVVLQPPYTGEDGSIAPLLSGIRDPAHIKVGAVFQAKNGMFLHGGLNYSQNTGSHIVGGTEQTNQAWGFDVRIGWHPGVKVYVPPPPPAPEIREVIREVPAPAVAAPAPNRAPTFTTSITANPGVVEPNGKSNLSSQATDADGDTITYTWTSTCGTFSTTTGQNTIWTAPANIGDCLLTVTASDGRGGSATNSITIPVIRREALVFDDAHFDFDKSNLTPEAIAVLDSAVMKLQANPTLNVTIEGHTDSVGTAEYNLSLGERRANAVRDYLLSRGIAAGRLKTVSYGEERPKADNATAAGRAINRRASFVTMTIQ